MADYNLFNPNSWHNRTLNHLNKVAESKDRWLSKTPKMVGLNFLAIPTATTAAFTQLAKFTFIQPIGMIATAGVGIVRVVTWSDFAQKVYENLPGVSDWATSAKKVAVLLIGALASALAIVGSIVTAKASTANVGLQNLGGVYENIEASEKKAAEEKEFQKAVEESKKLPKISVIQTQADVAKNDAVKFEKNAVSNKEAAQDIATKAKTAAFDDLDSLITLSQNARKEAAENAKFAKEKADDVAKYVEQAQIKLKAKETDQAAVDALSKLSKDTKIAAENTQTVSKEAIESANAAIQLCQNRKNDLATAQNYLKLAQEGKKTAETVVAEALVQKQIAKDELEKAHKDQSNIDSNLSAAKAVVNTFSNLFSQVQMPLFADWETFIDEVDAEDPAQYGAIAVEIHACAEAVKDAVEAVKEHADKALAAQEKIEAIQAAMGIMDIAVLKNNASASAKKIEGHLQEAEQIQIDLTSAKKRAEEGKQIDNLLQTEISLKKATNAFEKANEEFKNLQRIQADTDKKLKADFITAEEAAEFTRLYESLVPKEAAVALKIAQAKQAWKELNALAAAVLEANKLSKTEAIQKEAGAALVGFDEEFARIESALKLAKEAAEEAKTKDLQQSKSKAKVAGLEAENAYAQAVQHKENFEAALKRLRIKASALQYKSEDLETMEKRLQKTSQDQVKAAAMVDEMIEIVDALSSSNASKKAQLLVFQATESLRLTQEAAKASTQLLEELKQKPKSLDEYLDTFEDKFKKLKDAEEAVILAKKFSESFNFSEKQLKGLSDEEKLQIKAEEVTAKKTASEASEQVENARNEILAKVANHASQLQSAVDETVAEFSPLLAEFQRQLNSFTTDFDSTFAKTQTLEEAKKAVDAVKATFGKANEAIDFKAVYEKPHLAIELFGKKDLISADVVQKFSDTVNQVKEMANTSEIAFSKSKIAIQHADDSYAFFEVALKEAAEIPFTNAELEQTLQDLAAEVESKAKELKSLKDSIESLVKDVPTKSLAHAHPMITQIRADLAKAEEMAIAGIKAADAFADMKETILKKEKAHKDVSAMRAILTDKGDAVVNAAQVILDLKIADFAASVKANVKTAIKVISEKTVVNLEKNVAAVSSYADALKVIAKAIETAKTKADVKSRPDMAKEQKVEDLAPKISEIADITEWTADWLQQLVGSGFISDAELKTIVEQQETISKSLKQFSDLRNESKEAIAAFDTTYATLPEGEKAWSLFG